MRLIATLAVAGFIVLLSTVPGEARPGDSVFVWLAEVTPPTLQKLMHLAAYSLLAFLCFWTLEVVERSAYRIAFTLALTVALGAVLEWCQTQIPGRFGNVLDVALNAIGSTLGVIAALVLI